SGAAGVLMPGDVLVIGDGGEPGSEAIAGVAAKNEAAVDIAEAPQALGIALIAAETVARKRAGLETVVVNQPPAHVVGAADVDAAAVLAEAGGGDEGKA